jgi:FtsX-like permease family protein
MSPVRLALRVIRVDRRTRLSAILTALGVAVATALVLLLVSLPFATKARAERTLWQIPDYGSENSGTVSWSSSDDVVDGRTITRIDVAPLTDPASIELPPGIEKLPGPGEMLRSPELAELAGERPAADLADRFDARPVGLLGEDALTFPEQLVVLVGHTPDTMPAAAMKRPTLGSGVAEADPLLSLLAGVGVVVLLIPSLVLVASASRLTAARREKRLAAFRLAGATPAQVTKMVAAETGVAAVVGAVLGVAVGPLFAHLATFVPWAGGTWQASDFTLPVGITVALALVIPVLVIGAAVAGLRRVVATPLVATGGHTTKQPKVIRLLILPVAGVLFVLSLKSDSSGMLPMLLALGLLMWSPTLVGPWLTSVLGGLFVRAWRRPAALLAGRRLRDDPKAAYRASAGVVLAAFAGAMALTIMPSLEQEAGYYSEFRDPVLYLTTDAERAPGIAAETDRKLADYGVDAKASVVSQVLLTNGDDVFQSAVVAPCAEAKRLLPITVQCADTPALYTPVDLDLTGVGLGDNSEQGTPLVTAQLPANVPVRSLTSTNGTAVIDPALVPAGAPVSQVYVAVPSDDASREATRTALLAASGGEQVVSKETELASQDTMLADLRRVTVIGLVTASLLAGVSAAIATAGSVMERRRTFGALMAAGTPVRTLAKALRTEAALPALVATIGAGALGTAVGVGLFGLVSQSLPTFSPWLAAPIVLGALVAVIAASVCRPALNRVRAEPLADE